TYRNKSEYARAVQDYDEAIRYEPALECVWNGRCWTRAIVGELQAALADCNEALRLKPDVTATLGSRGLIYLKMGQWDSGITIIVRRCESTRSRRVRSMDADLPSSRRGTRAEEMPTSRQQRQSRQISSRLPALRRA